MKLRGVLWGFRETPLPRPPKAIPGEALRYCEGHTFEDTRYHKTHRAVKQSRPKRPREAGRGTHASEPLLRCRVPGAKAGTREGAEAANPIWTGCSLARVQLLVKPAGRLPPAPGGCELGTHTHTRAGVHSPPGLAWSSRASTAACGTTFQSQRPSRWGTGYLLTQVPSWCQCRVQGEMATFRGDEVLKGFEHHLLRKM